MKFLIIIGAPKAGTSTLATLLGQHPDMQSGVFKEPSFFTDFDDIPWQGPGAERFRASIISDEKTYLESFGTVGLGTWCIDASTDYLSCPVSAERIKAWSKRFPTRLVCVLRDPVARAISQYQHTVRDGFEANDLGCALKLEEERFLKNWQPLFQHVRRSQYYDDLQRFRNLFGPDLLLLDFAWLRDLQALQKRMEDFLELDPTPPVKVEKRNASYVPRLRILRDFLDRPNALRRQIGRVLPARIRHGLYRAASDFNKRQYLPRPDELVTLRSSLQSEYQRCGADLDIPTESWTK